MLSQQNYGIPTARGVRLEDLIAYVVQYLQIPKWNT